MPHSRPGFTRIARLCAAVLITLSLPTDASARWATLKTDHFVFVGDASERQIRSVAEKLEQFHEVVTRLFPGSTVTPRPTVVIVFADDRSLRPYAPHFEGRPIDVAGYFISGEDGGTIAVNAEVQDVALATVYHEYAHSIVANTGAVLPVWAGEGIAEVYQSFQTRDGGRSAVIGIAPGDHVELLRRSTLIPLSQLLAVTHDSSLYNEGSRRSVLYAQSWALMHYLMLGNQTRAQQLRSYLAALRTGGAPDQAFRGAFGDDLAVLQQELFEYVRNFTFPAVKYNFDAKLGATASGRTEPLEDAEAHGYLGDMIARTGRKDDAVTLLTAAMKTNPRAVRPAVALGLLHLRGNKTDEAIAALQAAVSRGPEDAAAHAVLGRALYLKLADGSTDNDARQQALAVLTRATDLDATDARPLALLASLELQRGGDAERAHAFVTRARTLAPSNEQYRLIHATVLIRLKQFDQAAGILGPLIAAGSTTSIREAARRLMGESVDYRAALERSANAAPAPPPMADAVSLARGDVASTPAPAAPRVVLDLRPVGPDETRVLGRFTAIECPANGVVVLLEVGDQTLRVGATRFDQIDFVSYRSDAPTSVSCGPVQAPLRVLATYRAGAKFEGAAHGEIVAIELVPDGYSPPN
jgi:tetratricopeptide (TPR) repeat protein